MARKYEIGIAADTSGFEKSIQNGLVDPLDDAADAFDDLDKAANSMDLDKEIEDGQRATDELKDELDDTRDALRKLGYAARDAGDDARKGMGRAEDGVKEFKDEANSTAREAAASFDGSFESIGEVAQEVAANAFAGFGPAGATAGIAVAAGAGVMIDAITKVGEAFDEARESAFTMAYDVGGALETAGVQARIAEWSQDTEKWKQVTDLAVATGWEEIDVLTALAKGGDDLDNLTQAFADNSMESTVTMGRLWELEAALKGTKDGYISGADAAKISASALNDYTRQVGVATGETDDLGNAIYKLPDQTQVVVNAATGEAYADVDAFESKVNSVKDKTVNVSARVSVDRTAYDRAIREMQSKTIRIKGRVVTTTDADWD